MAAAALLKSKRVPPRLDFLFAPPSRQTLELLAHVGALGDLIATGARLLEPDHRVVTGELYPSPAGGTSLRSQDPEPAAHPQERFITTSPETVAYAVATGTIGDPRSFKRPVRISVPRALPTDDVLIERKSKGKAKADGEPNPSKPLGPPPRYGWTAATALPLAPARTLPATPSVQVLRSLEDVRWTAVRAPALNATVRAIIAPHVPADLVSTFASLGILALACPTDELERLDGPLSFGEPRGWDGEPQLAGLVDTMSKWVEERAKSANVPIDKVLVLIPAGDIPMPIVIQVIAGLRKSPHFERVILGGQTPLERESRDSPPGRERLGASLARG